MLHKHSIKRYQKTLQFVNQHISPKTKILDLGTPNPLADLLRKNGYVVSNTNGENLDTNYQLYTNTDAEVITAFEIFEHLLAPYNFLSNVKTNKLIASVPLKLWFKNAYWNDNDDWDKHYHEFEVKQFNFLLEKTGWKIIASEQWTSASWKSFGIRPLLRHFTPRYYIVYCERV